MHPLLDFNFIKNPKNNPLCKYVFPSIHVDLPLFFCNYYFKKLQFLKRKTAVLVFPCWLWFWQKQHLQIGICVCIHADIYTGDAHILFIINIIIIFDFNIFSLFTNCHTMSKIYFKQSNVFAYIFVNPHQIVNSVGARVRTYLSFHQWYNPRSVI